MSENMEKNTENLCPCCGRHCDLSEPSCDRGREYLRTGVIPERTDHEGPRAQGELSRREHSRGEHPHGRDEGPRRGEQPHGERGEHRHERGGQPQEHGQHHRGEDCGSRGHGREDRDHGRGGCHGGREQGPKGGEEEHCCGKGRQEGRTGRRDRRGGKSVLGTERYAALDTDDKLAALFRELSNWERFRFDGKSSQNRILHLLAREGSMTQRELTERINIQSGSASEVLGKLERAGSIVRTPSEADRRTVDVRLTEQGQAQADAQTEARRERTAQRFAALDEGEKATLLALLEKLSQDWQVQFTQEKADEPAQAEE